MMINIKRHKVLCWEPKVTADDGYYSYFRDIYKNAMTSMKSGNRMQALKMLRRGSRQYAELFRSSKCVELSPLIYDECSLWLSTYYARQGSQRKLKRILKRNFVGYKENYYLLTTGNVVWRMVPYVELNPEYDFGLDIPDGTDTEAILRLIRERRGV